MAGFDYVIVGAGSAGCVLANRLSEDPGVRVLLLEAGGPDRSPKIRIPAAFAQQFKTRLDWDFASGPEPHADDRLLYVPRGKGLGGSSSMNAMLYVRGRREDYDGWRDAGATGWGFDDVKPYFDRAERTLSIVPLRSPRPVTRAFVQAAQAHGIPFNPNYNRERQDGVSVVHVTQRDGRRWSAADAYLKPARKRGNLEVVTGAHVLGVALEGGRATGVRYRRRRAEELVRAEREVILSAGAIGCPQLLLLSGIGPAGELRAAGIEPRVDSPNVGSNLQDHPYVTLVWDLPGGGSLADAEKPKALAELLLRRSGPLTSTVAEAFAWVRSRDGLPGPDLQYHFAPAYFVDNGFREYDGHALTFGPVLVNPASRGKLSLRSPDPRAKPAIVGNHLAEPQDVAALVHGFHLACELAATAPLSEVVGRQLVPAEQLADDAAVEAWVRRTVELIYHPVGTCRMGSDAEAVLDPELRVRGVEGLRVIDASVMPAITSGNTNAPTIMIGERGADLVRGRLAHGEAAQPADAVV